MEDRQIISNFRFLTAILFLAVIICFIVIALLLKPYLLGSAFNLVTDNNQNQPANITSLAPISVEAKKFCAQQVAICGKDCPSALPEADCFDAYYSRQAVTEKNVDLCTSIANIETKTSCLDNVYLDLAVEDKNLDLCQKLSQTQTKQSCSDQVNYILAVTNPTKAKTYCSAIVLATLKNSCLKKFVK